MTFAVELYFDAVADASVRHVWQTLTEAGISASMFDGGYRPHVSLGVSTGLGQGACEALASFAASVPPFALTLSSLGIFPTAKGVVFLGVTVTRELLDLHAAVQHLLQAHATDPQGYYRVGQWVPHCTLAFGLPAESTAEAVAVCQQLALPLRAAVKALGVVEVSPTSCTTLCVYPLGQPTGRSHALTMLNDDAGEGAPLEQNGSYPMNSTVHPSFCERFAEIWSAPTAEAMGQLFTEDVILYQPHLPPIRGKQAAIAEFRRLFSWLPGTYSKVKRWQEDNTLALIEHELHIPVGAGFIRIPAVDRFILEAGFAKERVVYFDQLRLIAGVLRHPSLWLGYLRYRWKVPGDESRVRMR